MVLHYIALSLKVNFIVDVRIDILREPSQGISLPFSILSRMLNSFVSLRSGPQAVIDEAFVDFVKQHSTSSSLSSFLTSLGISETAMLEALERYLL